VTPIPRGQADNTASIPFLLNRYKEIRLTEHHSAQRTAEMTAIVGQLIPLMSQLKDFNVESALSSLDEGDHLGAVVYLYANPDAKYLDSLLQAMINEKEHFIQYWGIEAIRSITTMPNIQVSNATKLLLKTLLSNVNDQKRSVSLY
jgi:hypothetical protein